MPEGKSITMNTRNINCLSNDMWYSTRSHIIQMFVILYRLLVSAQNLISTYNVVSVWYDYGTSEINFLIMSMQTMYTGLHEGSASDKNSGAERMLGQWMDLAVPLDKLMLKRYSRFEQIHEFIIIQQKNKLFYLGLSTLA